jgi:hypothetical protein
METVAARNEQPAGAPALAYRKAQAGQFPPLDAETRETLPTDCAAYHLLRRPQTLRGWACLGNGPIQPVRIGCRLGWRTADVRRLLGVAR